MSQVQVALKIASSQTLKYRYEDNDFIPWYENRDEYIKWNNDFSIHQAIFRMDMSAMV